VLQPEVRRLELRDPGVQMRAYAVTRRGREAWAPLRLVAHSVQQHHAGE
jgi:hypothetical protein